MKKFVGSIALIRHPDDAEHRWLAIWDQNQQQYDFVTAERLDGESLRECLDREIAWLLPLRRGKDYLISSHARLNLEIAIERPTGTTVHAIGLYVVDLFGKRGPQQIENETNVAWLSSREVLAGLTATEQRISPRLVSILRKADVFTPESQ